MENNVITKINGNNNFNFIILVIYLTFLTFVIISYLDEEIEKNCKPSEYKVYYEYNVYNNDTIPIDTVYVKIK